LQWELEAARDERDLFRSLLLADGPALADFFTQAAVSIECMRSLLRLPTREPHAFRGKIERLLAEITTIGRNAGALRLPTVDHRLLACEQTLREIQARAVISGNDLLPAMVLIEDLCSHIAFAGGSAGMHLPLVDSEARQVDPRSPRAPPRLAQALQQIADQSAAQQAKQISLVLLGLEVIPEDWHSALFDVLNQLVRNAVEHGIEAPATRGAQQKPGVGTLIAEFLPRDDGVFELNFQDDGQGLDAGRIAEVAVGSGLLQADAVAKLKPHILASLIFHNGLTTLAESSRRGIGMNIVRERVQELRGRIQVTTKRGHFTRYRITLPSAESSAGLAQAAGLTP